MNNKWNTLASDEQIEATVKALQDKNFNVIVVNSGEEAKAKVLELMPKGANVGVNTSITLDTIGVSEAIDNSGNYDSQRKKYMALDHKTQGREIVKLRANPDWALGSAHAVSKDGIIMIASNSGSNIPSYAYTSEHVVLVIGTQKLVDTIEDGLKRIYEHSLPLETVRARKAYGLPETWNSYPSKILLFEKEPVAGRTTVILVKEILGY